MNTQKAMTNRRESAPVAQQKSERRWLTPPVDIFENADEFLITADLPGVKQDGVRIHYERGRIDVEASWEEPMPDAKLISGQMLGGAYRRSFSIPGTIDVNNVGAELKEGVLWLRLPKSEQAKPRQIQVRTG